MEISKEINNGVCTAYFAGEFKFNAHEIFEKEIISSLKREDISQINIDMTKITTIDSAGMGMLLILKEAAQEAGKELSLSSAQGQVKKMIFTAKFDKLFNYSEKK